MRCHIDVTDLVSFDNPEDEFLPITKCICGETFASWEFIISIYDENPSKCPKCGGTFYFRNAVRVYGVKDRDLMETK